MAKSIRLAKRVVAESDRLAGELVERFRKARVFVANLMGSPGSGKTSLLEETARRLGGELRMAVIAGDLATDRDAQRIRRAGIPSYQINTGGGCHLSARQILDALEQFDLAALDVLFIENVGNLVCPAEFELGEWAKVAVLSVTEGEDKPLKYPGAFRGARVVVVSKMDLVPHLGVDLEALRRNLRTANPALETFELSARSGEGLEGWVEWLVGCHEAWRGAE